MTIDLGMIVGLTIVVVFGAGLVSIVIGTVEDFREEGRRRERLGIREKPWEDIER